MKTSSLVLLLLCTTLLLSTSCKDRCKNVEVGSIDLHETSKAYMVYEDGEILIFENDMGEQLLLEVDVLEEPYFICTKFLCELTTDPFETVPCENYAAMGIRNILRQTNNPDLEQNIFIDMSIGTVNYEEESTLFYDHFVVAMSSVGSLARGEAVAYTHFADPVLDPARINMIEPFLTESTLVFGNDTFENMLLTTDGAHEVHYQISEGIKFIKLDNSYYKLVE